MLTQTTQWMATDTTRDTQTVCELTLAYDPAVPHAIQILFALEEDDPDAVLVWEVDRTLLITALTSWGGEGDVKVRVWPSLPQLAVIELRDTDTGRWGKFLARRHELAGFIERTFEDVPVGTEVVDIDDLLEQLLGGESP